MIRRVAAQKRIALRQRKRQVRERVQFCLPESLEAREAV
jgi:hypothetical protein